MTGAQVFKMLRLSILLVGHSVFASGIGVVTSSVAVIPTPAKLEVRQGWLLIDQSFQVGLSGPPETRVQKAAARLIARLSRQTGMPLATEPAADLSKATLRLTWSRRGKPIPSLDDDESYTLDVTPSEASLQAAEPTGILRGIETFLQLVETGPDGFTAAAVHIEDRPRFRWRGLLIDMAHHFVPMEVLKRNLDAMAAVKLNVVQLHLASDYGFRIESKRYPRLHGMGSDGDFYTQEEMRGLIAYAAERGIRILPGLEMPGHITSWFVGYPELATTPGPFQLKRFWGHLENDPVLDVTREEVYPFLDGLLGEMAALFPDEYFHIGGDEVVTSKWSGNPRIRTFMQDHGLKSTADLQTWFNRRLDAIVRKHGKKMVGWDEILHPDLPSSAVVHVWRARQTLAHAVRQGHLAILSFGYYLDHMRPAAAHYAVDPLGPDLAGLSAAEQARVLGGHACMWSEYVSSETLDSRLWPRTAAVAERLWSPGAVNDVSSMYSRLAVLGGKLEWLALTHRTGPARMLGRLAGQGDVNALRVLAGALEPGRRSRIPRYYQSTPLNHLVDAVPPESDTAREFGELVARGAWPAVEALLKTWRENHRRVQPTIEQSFLLRDVMPVSENLAASAAAGLEAIQYLEQGRLAPPEWRQRQLAVLDEAAKPRAELSIAVLPHIRALVTRAAGH